MDSRADIPGMTYSHGRADIEYVAVVYHWMTINGSTADSNLSSKTIPLFSKLQINTRMRVCGQHGDKLAVSAPHPVLASLSVELHA